MDPRDRALRPGLDEERFLAYVACAEQRLSHPIAKAILRKAQDLRIQVPGSEGLGEPGGGSGSR